MRIGGAMFFTDYSMSPTELARALEERGFDSLWVPEHSHIPLTRKSPFPSGGDLPKKYYDVMDPFVVLGAAAAVTKTLLLGHRHLPDRPARPDPDRQAGRFDRPDLGRPFPVRHRQRLERGRDGQPRHRFREPPQAGARACRGHEGNLDQVKGRVSWRVRELRPDDGLAEAGPETASADHRRRRLPVRRAARLALRRRLDAPPHAHPVCGRAGPAAEIPRDGGRSGPRSRRRCRSRSGAPRRTSTCSSATATTASHAWSSASIPPRPIRSCRNSTAGRR